eukprot:Gb_18263 [translate_table: standard]
MAALPVAVSVPSSLSSEHIGGNTLDLGSAHYGRLLQRCVQINSLPEGKAIHARMIKLGFELETFLGNSLVNMYSKCGSLDDACKIFENIPERNVVSWNVMIAGYAQQGRGKETIKLFEEMRCMYTIPDEFTFGSVLKACASQVALEEGKQVHCQIIKMGFEQHVFLGSALVDMYSKCGSVGSACDVFHKISQRNVVSWNALIAGCVLHGRHKEALKLFGRMQSTGIKPSHVTFGCVLKACAGREALNQGKQLHACVIKYRFGPHTFVGSALVVMYVKCGRVDYAQQVFDKMPEVDLGLYNATIQGYADSGRGDDAIKLFRQVLQTGLEPDDVTFAVVLRACAILEALEQGQQIHARIIKTVFEPCVSVFGALVTMYARCGSIDGARRVFDKSIVEGVVLWTAMIAGYAQNGHSEAALKLYLEMQHVGVEPNQFTFPSVLSACAGLAALEEGKQVHAHIVKTGLVSDVFVGSGLVDMYAKCRSIEDAQRGFDKMPLRDIVSWNTMIAGYAQNGCAKEALQVFEQMQQSGIKPNHNTFVGVLSACSHVGLVGLGRRYFHSLSRIHGITPSMEHYACMVDLLGRAGHLYEAEDLINNMPFEPGALVWETLLRACRIHSNMELGERVGERLVRS